MNSRSLKGLILILFFGALVIGLLWTPLSDTLMTQNSAERRATGPVAIPVEVHPVERGAIAMVRVFSGTLEPRAEFIVAPKVGARLESLFLNISDTVTRGAVVGALDNAEFMQAVAQARADLAVAEASRAEAANNLQLTSRKLKRIQALYDRGVASEAQLDAAAAERSASLAEHDVAEAQYQRARSLLETARIRLGYTEITADWSGGSEIRRVAERFVDEGELVAPNTPLLRIVELETLTGLIFVPERDYAQLRGGQAVQLSTDAYPGESFAGRIARIAPVFDRDTRQVRVELTVANPDLRLKPGMFIRARVELKREANALIVPEQALTRRDDSIGVFLVDESRSRVVWREVTPGIRRGGRVQIHEQDVNGLVVVLGQQQLRDNSTVQIVAPPSAADDDTP